MHSVKDWFYGAGPYEGEELIKGLQQTFRDYLDITSDGQTSTWIQVYGLSKGSGERIIEYEGWKTGEFYDEALQTLAISFNVKSAEYTIHISDQQENDDINRNNRRQNKPHAVLTYMLGKRRTEIKKFRPTLVQATHYYTTNEGEGRPDVVEFWEIAKSPDVPRWRNPQDMHYYEEDQQRAEAERVSLETLEKEREAREIQDRINAGWQKQDKVPSPFLAWIPHEVQKLRANGYSEVTQEGNIVDVPFDDITVRIVYNTAWFMGGIRVYILKTIDGNIVEIPFKLYIVMKTGKQLNRFNLIYVAYMNLWKFVNVIKEINNEGHTQLSDEVLRLFLNENYEVNIEALALLA